MCVSCARSRSASESLLSDFSQKRCGQQDLPLCLHAPVSFTNRMQFFARVRLCFRLGQLRLLLHLYKITFRVRGMYCPFHWQPEMWCSEIATPGFVRICFVYQLAGTCYARF